MPYVTFNPKHMQVSQTDRVSSDAGRPACTPAARRKAAAHSHAAAPPLQSESVPGWQRRLRRSVDGEYHCKPQFISMVCHWNRRLHSSHRRSHRNLRGPKYEVCSFPFRRIATVESNLAWFCNMSQRPRICSFLVVEIGSLVPASLLCPQTYLILGSGTRTEIPCWFWSAVSGS